MEVGAVVTNKPLSVMKEVTLEFVGFYKKVSVYGFPPYLDCAITPTFAMILSAMQGLSSESEAKTRMEVSMLSKMRFEQDSDVPTLYKFKGVIK